MGGVCFFARTPHSHTDLKDFKDGYAAWRLHGELHTLEYLSQEPAAKYLSHEPASERLNAS